MHIYIYTYIYIYYVYIYIYYVYIYIYYDSFPLISPYPMRISSTADFFTLKFEASHQASSCAQGPRLFTWNLW